MKQYNLLYINKLVYVGLKFKPTYYLHNYEFPY